MASIDPPETFEPPGMHTTPPGSPDTLSSYNSPTRSEGNSEIDADIDIEINTQADKNEPEPVLEAQPFNIFQEIVRQPEIFYEFTRHLDPDEFVTLYSISRPFHTLVNDNLATCMERNAITNAPESVEIFPFNCYRALCNYDPLLKSNESSGKKTTESQARDVPSFRWLRFIRFREITVDSIMLHMAEAGHLLPINTTRTLKKIWLLMDFPDNARRIGTIHNRELWTDTDLFLATMFFIKLDMRVTDPMDGANRPIIRRILMAQPTLSAVDGVLRRRQMRDMHDFIQMYVEWRVLPQVPVEDINAPNMDWTIFGIPITSAGSLRYEGRIPDVTRNVLLRPDELVMKEGIRRELRMDRWYLDCMLWGHVDEDTGEDIWPPSARKKMMEETHDNRRKRKMEDEGEGEGEERSPKREHKTEER